MNKAKTRCKAWRAHPRHTRLPRCAGPPGLLRPGRNRSPRERESRAGPSTLSGRRPYKEKIRLLLPSRGWWKPPEGLGSKARPGDTTYPLSARASRFPQRRQRSQPPEDGYLEEKRPRRRLHHTEGLLPAKNPSRSLHDLCGIPFPYKRRTKGMEERGPAQASLRSKQALAKNGPAIQGRRQPPS